MVSRLIVERGASVRWAVAERPMDIESGDRSFVAITEIGMTIAVLDALGHGKGAADTARTALAALHRHAALSPESLVRACHADMLGTRGAAVSLAFFPFAEPTMQWLGVGNVSGFFYCSRLAGFSPQSLLLSGGVIGYILPPLRNALVDVHSGDLIVLSTDGIDEVYADDPFLADACPGCDPQEIADYLLRRYGRKNDDALVLVARCEDMGI